MSLDLFMNDACPKCRKLIKMTAVEPHPTNHGLAVAQVRMRKLRARNQQDSLPKAERCRFLNKPQLSTAARRISPATDRNTIPGTAARFRRYCQSRLSEARRRRFCSWRTSLRSSDGQSRGESVRGPTSLPVDQLPQQAAQALSRLSHSGHRGESIQLGAAASRRLPLLGSQTW